METKPHEIHALFPSQASSTAAALTFKTKLWSTEEQSKVAGNHKGDNES
jgi:hypothetical protein